MAPDWTVPRSLQVRHGSRRDLVRSGGGGERRRDGRVRFLPCRAHMERQGEGMVSSLVDRVAAMHIRERFARP